MSLCSTCGELDVAEMRLEGDEEAVAVVDDDEAVGGDDDVLAEDLWIASSGLVECDGAGGVPVDGLKNVVAVVVIID
jgi:hypothetical protein